MIQDWFVEDCPDCGVAIPRREMSDQPMNAEPVTYCEHVCILDDAHVERGEPHFYGYRELVHIPTNDEQYWEGWSDGQDVLKRDLMSVLDLIKGHCDDCS